MPPSKKTDGNASPNDGGKKKARSKKVSKSTSAKPGGAADLTSDSPGAHWTLGEVSKLFKEIAVFMELLEEDSRRIGTYARIGRAFEKKPTTVLEFLQSGEKIPGVGASTLERLRALVRDDRLELYEELRGRIPAGVLEMLTLSGLGPKKARMLWRALDLISIGELEYACRENRLVELEGFGQKTQEKFLDAIVQHRLNASRFLIHEADEAAQEFLPTLRAIDPAAEVTLTGALRRRLEIVDTAEYLVTTAAPEEWLQAAHNNLADATQTEDSSNSLATKLDVGLPARIVVAVPDSHVPRLIHSTATDAHWQSLVTAATKKGLTLSPDALQDKAGTALDLPNEHAFFDALGLPYLPPEVREEPVDEFLKRQANNPAELVTVADLRGILHFHTTASDGMFTLEEARQLGRERGWQYMGVSDHSQAAFYAHGLTVERIAEQHAQIDRLNAEKAPDDPWLLKGIESDILPDGSLDYPDDVLATFDFVIASVHSGFRADEKAMTERIISAVSHPATTILGHPSGRILLSRNGYPLDIEAVLQACKEHDTAVELNASPYRLDLDWRHCRRAKELGVPVSINPDAHSLEGFDVTAIGVDIARKAGLTAADVFNAQTLEAMQTGLER